MNKPLCDTILKLQLLLLYAQRAVTAEELIFYLKIDTLEFQQAISSLKTKLAADGLELQQAKSGYKIEVQDIYREFVANFKQLEPIKLSKSSLEVLAIIASRQPITRSEIGYLRGVSISSDIMKNLKALEYIKTHGKKDLPGRPSLWITTDKLLEDLNLNSKQELKNLCEEIQQKKIEF